MTEEQIERMLKALKKIAAALSWDGSISEELMAIRDRLNEIIAEDGERAERSLRVMDIGRD